VASATARNRTRRSLRRSLRAHAGQPAPQAKLRSCLPRSQRIVQRRRNAAPQPPRAPRPVTLVSEHGSALEPLRQRDRRFLDLARLAQRDAVPRDPALPASNGQADSPCGLPSTQPAMRQVPSGWRSMR
jgi:hypothetical protein